MNTLKVDVEQLTYTEKRVLVTLQRHWRFPNGGNCWKSHKKLSEFIRKPLNETKQAVYSLKEKGVLGYSVAVTDEGMPHGSGYFLTGQWGC